MNAVTLHAWNPGKVAAASEPESRKATAPASAAALSGQREEEERIFFFLRFSSLFLDFCFEGGAVRGKIEAR